MVAILDDKLTFREHIVSVIKKGYISLKYQDQIDYTDEQAEFHFLHLNGFDDGINTEEVTDDLTSNSLKVVKVYKVTSKPTLVSVTTNRHSLKKYSRKDHSFADLTKSREE